MTPRLLERDKIRRHDAGARISRTKPNRDRKRADSQSRRWRSGNSSHSDNDLRNFAQGEKNVCDA